MEPSSGRVPVGRTAGSCCSLTTQTATDTAGNSGEPVFRKCRKTIILEWKQIETIKNYYKKSHFGVDVREVTGSSPVSSTTKTTLFERKEWFFLTFSETLRNPRLSAFALTTVSATDREKFALWETLVPEGVGLFSSGFGLDAQVSNFFPHLFN